MRIPKQIKTNVKVFTGALLFAASLIILMFIDSELERQGNIVSVSSYEVAK